MEVWRPRERDALVLGSPRGLWLRGGRRGREGRKKAEGAVARERDADMRRVCPAHVAPRRKDTPTVPAALGRKAQATNSGQATKV